MATEPYDEEKIKGTDIVIRRVPNQQIVWDENSRRQRVSSALYSKSSGLRAGMSVDIEELILRDGLRPTEYVITPDFQGAVAFCAAQIRSLDLIVGYDPIVNDPSIPDNPYHGEVWRRDEARRFTGAQQKGLVEAAVWYVEIDGVASK